MACDVNHKGMKAKGKVTCPKCKTSLATAKEVKEGAWGLAKSTGGAFNARVRRDRRGRFMDVIGSLDGSKKASAVKSLVTPRSGPNVDVDVKSKSAVPIQMDFDHDRQRFFLRLDGKKTKLDQAPLYFKTRDEAERFAREHGFNAKFSSVTKLVDAKTANAYIGNSGYQGDSRARIGGNPGSKPAHGKIPGLAATAATDTPTFDDAAVAKAKNDIRRGVMVRFGGDLMGPALKSVEVSDEDARRYLSGTPIEDLLPVAKSVQTDTPAFKDAVSGDWGDKKVYELADAIRKDWRNVNFGAKPYLDAMHSLGSVSDNYGQDPGKMVVAYFLSNARSWTGPVAKQIKAELKRRIK